MGGFFNTGGAAGFPTAFVRSDSLGVISTSANVTGVTHLGVGQYNVQFAVGLFTVVPTFFGNPLINGGFFRRMEIEDITNLSVSDAFLNIYDDTNTLIDCAFSFMAISSG